MAARGVQLVLFTELLSIVFVARDLRLFTTLEEIKEEQKEIKKMLGQVLSLMRNMSGVDSGSTDSGLPEEISIPATTVEDMIEWRNSLIPTVLFLKDW